MKEINDKIDTFKVLHKENNLSDNENIKQVYLENHECRSFLFDSNNYDLNSFIKEMK